MNILIIKEIRLL